jgi:hypothetical protein
MANINSSLAEFDKFNLDLERVPWRFLDGKLEIDIPSGDTLIISNTAEILDWLERWKILLKRRG